MVINKKGIIILVIIIVLVILAIPNYTGPAGWQPPANPTIEDYKAHLGKPGPGPGTWAYKYFVQQQDDPNIETWIMDAATSDNKILRIRSNFILFKWGINRDDSIKIVLEGLREIDLWTNRSSEHLLRYSIDSNQDSDILPLLYDYADIKWIENLILKLGEELTEIPAVSSTVDPEDLEVHPQF